MQKITRASAWGTRVSVVADKYLHRKLRLLACGCCRRIWHRLPEGPYRQAIEMAERYADGAATARQLRKARDELHIAMLPFEPATRDKVHRAVLNATKTYDQEDVPRLALVALSTAWEIGELGPAPEIVWHTDEPQWDTYVEVRNSDAFLDERRIRTHLIRDVIPSPTEKIEFDPDWLSWHNETLSRMANMIYDDHQMTDLPFLADALEEAGCTSAYLLDHCRQDTPHIRGCWVLDLLRGQE